MRQFKVGDTVKFNRFNTEFILRDSSSRIFPLEIYIPKLDEYYSFTSDGKFDKSDDFPSLTLVKEAPSKIVEVYQYIRKSSVTGELSITRNFYEERALNLIKNEFPKQRIDLSKAHVHENANGVYFPWELITESKGGNEPC